jgi:hypothetical protein
MNFVYFGHLRHWDVEQLASKLRGLTEQEEIAVLSGQLVCGRHGLPGTSTVFCSLLLLACWLAHA